MANKTRIKYKYKPSNMPFIVTGILWAGLAFILPMHKYFSYLILAVVCLIAYILMRKFKVFKDVAIRYEEELSFEEMELEDVLSQGQSYIDSFEDSKRKIYNTEVKNDIDGIIRISNAILEDVKKDPKGINSIRKFISYYLPMIDKMLKAYVDFERTTSSSQIEQSKRKIENMLKTVQKAFTSLYDSLHEDESIDISSDIKVLESLLSQEGFLDK